MMTSKEKPRCVCCRATSSRMSGVACCEPKEDTTIVCASCGGGFDWMIADSCGADHVCAWCPECTSEVRTRRKMTRRLTSEIVKTMYDHLVQSSWLKTGGAEAFHSRVLEDVVESIMVNRMDACGAARNLVPPGARHLGQIANGAVVVHGLRVGIVEGMHRYRKTIFDDVQVQFIGEIARDGIYSLLPESDYKYFSPAADVSQTMLVVTEIQ